MELSFRGYVKFPEVKTTSTGKTFNQFKVNTKNGKDREGKDRWVNITCKDFNVDRKLPSVESFVTIKGLFNVVDYEKDGLKKYFLDCFVQELDVSPPREKVQNTEEIPEWLKNA